MTNKSKKNLVLLLILVAVGLLYYNHKENSNDSEKSTTISSTYDKSSESIKDKKAALVAEWEQKYNGNHLENGAQPYSFLYGSNKTSGISEIKITAPVDEDAIVMIKDDKGKVARHAYIRNNMNYTFHISPGYYQVFFICGRNWCPEKVAPNGQKGYFLQASISKANAEYIGEYEQLEYRLQSTINGNFRPQDADSKEAF